MNINVYNSIKDSIQQFKGLSKDCILILFHQFPHVDKNTLRSILSYHYQILMKKNHYKLQQYGDKIYKSYNTSLENKEYTGILLRLTQKYDVVPTSIARVILEKYLCELSYVDNDANNLKATVSKMLKDTTLINDMDLAYEVYLCVIYDDQHGPIFDVVRRSIGIEYEERLQKILKEKNIIFRAETDLRIDGFDKTPDIKLDIPVAVDGFVINWVESKALFGNDTAHKGYVKDQYLSYWNRFGPGLIIYWFGYLETIVDPTEKRFLIKDNFPENVTYINPDLIETNISV